LTSSPSSIQIYYDPPTRLQATTLLVDTDTDTDAKTKTVVIDGINSCLRFAGKIANMAAKIDIDTGATHCFISEKFATMIGLHVEPCTRAVALADGQTVRAKGVAKARMGIGELNDVCTFLVLQLNSAYDVLLGEDWLTKHNAVLDFQQGSMTVTRSTGRPVVISDTHATGQAPSGGGEAGTAGKQVPMLSALQLKRYMRKGKTGLFRVTVMKCSDAEADAQPDPSIGPHAAIGGDPKMQEEIAVVLDKYKVVFEDLPHGVIHRPGLPQCEIPTEEGKQPPVGALYRLTKEEKKELTRQLTLALEGWIEPSKAPYGAPVLFAKKKTGGLRMCIDYRALNKITVKNRYPLPRIDDLLDQLNAARVFSGLDLAAGYWQIPLREEDKPKTTMRTFMGSYQWTVMPFGLTNAPAVFQSTMQSVLGDVIGKFVLVYLDDILIFSKTPEEHAAHLEFVL